MNENESYRAVLVRGKPRQLIVGLGFAWLSFGTVGLAIFLTTHRATSSYGSAGATLAAFWIGSGFLAPLRGRLLDRRGVRPWLVVFAAGYAAGLLALVVLAQTNGRTWMLMVCAAGSGASGPPLVASVRALWPSVVEEALLRRAYALTSVVSDVGLVAAPALAGLLFVWVSWLPLVISAIGAGVAAVIVARTSAPQAQRGDSAANNGTALLLNPGFVVVVAVELALAVALGLVEVAVPTAATVWGDTAYSGLLLAAFALGSVLGGIWFGRRRWTSTPERRYLISALLLAACLLAPIAAMNPATLALLLLIPGLSYGPATVSLYEALDNLTGSRPTEAFTWLTTAGAVGAAVGNAGAGWATTSIGLWAPFAAASAVPGIAAAFGLMRAGDDIRRDRPHRALRRKRA